MDLRNILLFLTFLIFSNSEELQNDNKELTATCVEIGKVLKLQVRGNVLNIGNINIDKCGGKTNFVEIFAEEKVIIDKDLILVGREMQVAIVAPIWEINGNRKIDLNGVNGEDFHTSAKDGNENGNKNGADGLAGLPAGPAGSFYGVANKIINGNQLKISANGGNGGCGQDGGNGATGRKGRTFNNASAFDCDKQRADGFESKFTHSSSGNLGLKGKKHFIVYGQKGELGGRGGNGGMSGSGSYAGSIVLFDFSQSDGKSLVSIDSHNGHPGNYGLAGKAGGVGFMGKDRNIYCTMWRGFSNYETRLKEIIINNTTSSDKTYHHHGDDGASTKMRKMSKSAPIYQTFPQTINEYKLYIRPKLPKINYNDSQLFLFYDSLNSREEVTKLYEVINLVDDFKELESQYFISEDRDYLTSSYNSLAKRFHDYSEKTDYKNKDDQVLNDVMHDLSLLVDTRIEIIKEPKVYSVMTNITNGLTSNGISPMKDLIEHENVHARIEAFIRRINPIDDLIKEAQDLINDDLQNAMKDLQITLERKINKILEEISQIINSKNILENDLIEKRKELKINFHLKALLGVLKIGCGVVGVVVPALGVAASVGSSALSFFQMQLSNESPVIDTVAKVGKALSNVSEKCSQFIVEPSKREAYLDNSISAMTTHMSEEGKHIVKKMKDEILKKIINPDTESESKSNKTFDWDQAYLEDITKNLEEAKKKNDMTKINDCEIQLRVVKFLKVGNELMSDSSSFLTDVLKNPKKVDEIHTALSDTQENLEKLYVIEEGLYKQTQPMLENMFNDINQAGHSMGKMNSNQMIISEWHVLDTIKEVQNKLKNTLESFKASEEMNWTLEKLISTFQVTTRLHKEILKNKDKISEATFITSLHIPTESKVLAQDHKLAWSLAELNKIFYQNELKDKYTEWIYAFKQFSFPNGFEFLSKTRYPGSSLKGKSVNQFMKEIKKNIENFEDYFNTEEMRDKFLVNQKVDLYTGSCSAEKKAFFIWNNESNYESISNILKGKKVTLVARGPIEYVDSLKFNHVGIIFTSENSTTLKELFNVLSKFSVSLTHHGDSTYIFENRTYLIETNPVVYSFKYPEGTNKITGISSQMHEKFINGDYMLSPYATWTIRLDNNTNKKNFDLLEEFIGKVDLELIGEGQYYESNGCDKQCQDKMTKTYRLLE